jgi:AraC-like DNA-binding protein
MNNSESKEIPLGSYPVLSKKLSGIVDYFFFINSTSSQLKFGSESIIPFPRITIGYFFGSPFRVIHSITGEEKMLNMALAKVQNAAIRVMAASEKIQIIGAHLKPYAISCFYNGQVKNLDWLTDWKILLPHGQEVFLQLMDSNKNPEYLVRGFEAFLEENYIPKELAVVTKAVELIEKSNGNIRVKDLALRCETTDRTLRNQFMKHIGCSPHELIRLTRIKQLIANFKVSSNASLTNHAYKAGFADQSHMNKHMDLFRLGPPKELKKNIFEMTFLQF